MSSADLLERFGGLPFTVEAELGSLELPIGEILDLKEGAVLRTDHPSGSPFTLCAGGRADRRGRIRGARRFTLGANSKDARAVTSNPGANGTD